MTEVTDDIPVEPVPPAPMPEEVAAVLDESAEGTITCDLFEFMFEGSVEKRTGEIVALNYELFAPNVDEAMSFFHRRARRRAEIAQDAEITWALDPSVVQVSAHARWCVAGTVEGTDGHNYRLWVHIFTDGYEGEPDYLRNSVESYLWAIFDTEETDYYVNWLSGPAIFESPESNPAPIVDPDPVLSMRQSAVIRRMVEPLEQQVVSEQDAIARHQNKIIEGKARIRELQKLIADAEGLISPEHAQSQGRLF